jgi:ABC-type polysaccharide/polyol phosphate export permease
MPSADRDDGRASWPWVENPQQGNRLLSQVRELWRYRELVGFLALRDLQVRYKQASFGVLWAVLQPLAGALALTVVFRRLGRVSSDGLPYLVFAFLGFSVWTYFSSSVAAANQSLVANSALITKVYFPRLAAPLASVLPGLVDLGVALVITAVLMVYEGIAPGLALLALPALALVVVLLALGVGLLLATLNVKYRDAHFAAGLLIQLWFFLTPVAYSSRLVPSGWRIAYHINPMAGVVDGFRWSLLSAPFPGTSAWASLGVTALLVAGGLAYFLRSERRFADVI